MSEPDTILIDLEKQALMNLGIRKPGKVVEGFAGTEDQCRYWSVDHCPGAVNDFAGEPKKSWHRQSFDLEPSIVPMGGAKKLRHSFRMKRFSVKPCARRTVSCPESDHPHRLNPLSLIYDRES